MLQYFMETSRSELEKTKKKNHHILEGFIYLCLQQTVPWKREHTPQSLKTVSSDFQENKASNYLFVYIPSTNGCFGSLNEAIFIYRIKEKVKERKKRFWSLNTGCLWKRNSKIINLKKKKNHFFYFKKEHHLIALYLHFQCRVFQVSQLCFSWILRENSIWLR